MRIIAGSARGQQLKAPKSRAIRPTADRVKEALFSIIAPRLAGSRVLDLFAGTGNLAIEALSRGAVEALLVDSSAASVQSIRDNLARLHFVAQASIWDMTVKKALSHLARRGESFDIIFLDPPYAKQLVDTSLMAIAEGRLLRPRGLAIAEHGVRDGVAEDFPSLVLRDQRRYGDTMLSFFNLDE